MEIDREQSRLHLLTLAQMNVLHWVAETKSNAEIALILGRSVGTVAVHVHAILRRLGVEKRGAAMLHYLRFTGRLDNNV